MHLRARRSSGPVEHSTENRLVPTVAFIAQINQPFGDGEFGQSRDAMDIQLVHYVLAVCFHRANAQSKGAGDFLIAKAFGDVDQNLPLAIGDLRGGWSFTGSADEFVQCHVRDSRAEKGLPEST